MAGLKATRITLSAPVEIHPPAGPPAFVKYSTVPTQWDATGVRFSRRQ
ncbi:hypothetical protein ABEW05_007047 [Botrytis cinerea]